MIHQVFADRREAGRLLAPLLEKYRGQRPIVLGLPRGGVAVAREVARRLGAPLDVLVVRKLGAPLQPELGMGAIAESGARFLDPRVVRAVGALPEEVERVTAEETLEVERRVLRYRGGRPLADLRGLTAILVDDGVATGGTARAGIRALRRAGAARVVIAAPVAAADAVETLAAEADDVVCLKQPDALWAIGFWYEDFAPVEDEEVLALLHEAWGDQAAGAVAGAAAGAAAGGPGARGGPAGQIVSISAEPVTLEGRLAVPSAARGLVLFAQGSGSSRRSRRDRDVARRLNRAGLATLLFDLLGPDEDDDDDHLRFDVVLLADRLDRATEWAEQHPATRPLRPGYFAASTGAAAALLAAARRGGAIGAVVSRGGRPDLVGDVLRHVYVPTLLIVGGSDHEHLAANRWAFERLAGPKELLIVPGATHLFTEPGALDVVAGLAADWFVRHLRPHPEEPAHP